MPKDELSFYLKSFIFRFLRCVVPRPIRNPRSNLNFKPEMVKLKGVPKQLVHNASPNISECQQQLIFGALEPYEESKCTIEAQVYGIFLGRPGASWNKHHHLSFALITQNHATITYHLKVIDIDSEFMKTRVDVIVDLEIFAGCEFIIHVPTDKTGAMFCFSGSKYGLGIKPVDSTQSNSTFMTMLQIICGVWKLNAKPPNAKAVDQAVKRIKSEGIQTRLQNMKILHPGAKVTSLEKAAREESGWLTVKGKGKLHLHTNPYGAHHIPLVSADPGDESIAELPGSPMFDSTINESFFPPSPVRSISSRSPQRSPIRPRPGVAPPAPPLVAVAAPTPQRVPSLKQGGPPPPPPPPPPEFFGLPQIRRQSSKRGSSPPPPPPPPPPLGMPPPPPPPADILQSRPPPAPVADRGALLDEIRRGRQLKKADKEDKEQPGHGKVTSAKKPPGKAPPPMDLNEEMRRKLLVRRRNQDSRKRKSKSSGSDSE